MRSLLLFGFLMLQAIASGVEAAGQSPAVSIPFEKYTLSNGMQVILAEDRRLPLVATNLRFHVGSANDPPGRTGFAHLFEHLYAFSPPADLPSPQSIGATQDGATTDPDRTSYYTTGPSSQLEMLLALESDRLRHFPERLDASLLAKERSNVRNERRLVVENEPYGLADEAIFQQLFPQGHPYHSKFIGSHADVEAARLEEARAFFTRYYVPSNVSLVIAGDIDRTRARALVEKYFGGIPAGAAVAPFKKGTLAIAAEKRVTVTDRIKLPRVTLAWVTAGWYEPGNVEAELLSVILGQGASSRLYERLVRQKRIAQDVVAEHLPFAQGSVFTIKATPGPGVTLPQLERAIDQELSVLRRDGPTAAEVEQARNAVTLSIVRGLEKLGDITAFGDFTMEGTYGGVAEQLNQCNHYFQGNPGCLPGVLERYREATPESLRRVAASTLATQSRVVVEVVPGEKVVNDVPALEASASTSPVQQQGEHSPASPAVQNGRELFQAPPAGPPSSIQPPVPQRFTLANGLTVLLAEQHQIPVITAHLVVRSGSGSSPVEHPGLAAFTVEMLLRGTGQRTALQMARDAARLGTALDTDISSDAAVLGARVLKQNVDSAFELLADAVMHPAFPQQELDRLRLEELGRLAQLRTNPDTLASYLFTEALYGKNNPYRSSGLFNDDLFARTHRYGYDEFGTKQSLKRLTRDELVDFWRRGYTPGNAALVVAGDVSLDELRVAAQKAFGGWSGQVRREESPRDEQGQGKHGRDDHGREERHPLNPDAPRRILIEDSGAASQTALRVGTVGASRGSPDLVPLRMLNFVFGEIFASRITTNLRERNNYTYMARSQFAFRREPGPFVIGTNVRTDVTGAALKELFREIERIRTERVSDEDLRFARTAFAGSLVGLFETTGRTASSIGQIFTYDLPLDYYQTLPKRIDATTAADIQQAAQRYLEPEKVVVVAVGDRSRIEADILSAAGATLKHEHGHDE